MTDSSTKSTTLGEDFARALAAKDADGLRRVLRPELDFRAMTPGRFWEADNAETVIDEIVFGKWFEPSDEIRELIAVETATIGHRNRVGYRLRVENADGTHLVEQQAFYEAEDERIVWLRIMCAGYVPVTD
jgi:hypothetical protein